MHAIIADVSTDRIDCVANSRINRIGGAGEAEVLFYMKIYLN